VVPVIPYLFKLIDIDVSFLPDIFHLGDYSNEIMPRNFINIAFYYFNGLLRNR